jgi:hypothetical protein
MDRITITLVQTADGLLVGRTASDRWNLNTILGDGHTLYADRNSIAVKRIRRRIEREFGGAFTVVIGRGCVRDLVERPSREEVQALGDALPLVVQPCYIPVIA